MRSETGVLKQRVEVLPVRWQRKQAGERVGGEDDERREGRCDERLNREGQRDQLCLDRFGGPGERAGIGCQHQGPEQHGALVIPPHAGDFVEQRLIRVRILGDVEDRKIRRDIKIGQAAEGDGDHQELHEGRRAGHRHPSGVAPMGADQR